MGIIDLAYRNSMTEPLSGPELGLQQTVAYDAAQRMGRDVVEALRYCERVVQRRASGAVI